MARSPAAARLAVVLLTVGLLAACTTEGNDAASEGRPPVYVAVGASESVGVGASDPTRDAWPEVFRRTALPELTMFVNLGVSGSNVAEALSAQVPRAVEARPALVTVWLNVNDIVDRVPPEQYERELGDLVHRLRRDGATKVLVANTPEVDQLPAVAQFGEAIAALADQAVAAYNQAIDRIVAREGAVLVDLHSASEEAEKGGRAAELIAADGFHPNTAGHAAAAAVFAEAFKSSGGI